MEKKMRIILTLLAMIFALIAVFAVYVLDNKDAWNLSMLAWTLTMTLYWSKYQKV